MTPSPKQRIKEKAAALGFDLVGVAPAGPARNAADLGAWLSDGFQADMEWMTRGVERRSDPRQVVAGAKSLIVLGRSYFVEHPPAALWDDPFRGRIARYAWGRDYHKVLPPLLKQLGKFLEDEFSTAPEGWRAYSDTGPVLERDAAARAGLGFIGRNSLLISPDRGSMVFLAVLITSLELEPDAPASGRGEELALPGTRKRAHCGSCSRCLEGCPTGAFAAPYRVDSRRCISYLSIEHRGALPEALRPRMGNWIFGCDLCQEVCPWVRKVAAPSGDDPQRGLHFSAAHCCPELGELLRMDDAAFLERFAGRPVMRTKRRGLLRNAAIALANTGDPSAIALLKPALQDAEPLVRSHAQWACDWLQQER